MEDLTFDEIRAAIREQIPNLKRFALILEMMPMVEVLGTSQEVDEWRARTLPKVQKLERAAKIWTELIAETTDATAKALKTLGTWLMRKHDEIKKEIGHGFEELRGQLAHFNQYRQILNLPPEN